MQADRRFRIVVTAALSMAGNLLYGAGHAVLGLLSGSPWLLVMAAYYALLGVMRLGAVWTERRHASEMQVMRLCGGLLMALALVLGASTFISLWQDSAAPKGTIIMITIAAFTFWKLTMAIVHTVQAQQSGTPLTKTIRSISLAGALASLLTMQRSMLVSFPGDVTAAEALILNACTGGAVVLLVFLMGLNMLYDEKGFEMMAKSKLAQANQKIAGAATEGFTKIADAVVGGYKKVEDGVVGGYKKVEDAFVDRYLTREGETVEECRERLRREAAEREEKQHEAVHAPEAHNADGQLTQVHVPGTDVSAQKSDE